MPIQIGCDPEYVLLNGNNRVNVDTQMNTEFGDAGTDHGGRVGELRPKHGHPKDVVNNIQKLILKIKDRYSTSNFKMIAGGGKPTSESIGGHIHISGLPFNYGRLNTYNCKKGLKLYSLATCEDKLIIALDFFIGRRLKRVSGGKRGSGSSYGQPSDVRHQSWGIEYRTPPSWLSEPKLAESVLALAYLIAKIWSVKPTAFDVIMSKSKIARKMDYSILINNSDNDAYFTTQVNNFKEIVFDRTYDMSQINCFESWTNHHPVAAERVASGSREIVMKVCQVKIINHDGSTISESVNSVCRFVTPEIRIYPINGSYPSYDFYFQRSLRIKENTIYISKDLRPFLKIKRELGIKIRFIDFNHRNSDPALRSTFMFDQTSSKPLMQSVNRIISECVRKKMRKEI